MTMTQIRYPVAPTTRPLRGTLLDLVTPSPDAKWHDGRGLYESLNCLAFEGRANLCPPTPDAAKDLSQNGQWIDGFRFTTYGGITCRAVGQDREGRRAEVERVFRSGESTAVERAFMDTRFVASTDDDLEWAAPEDITPGAAVTPKVGVALLEEFAASIYVGQPIIHVPRSIGALLLDGNGAKWEGDALRTNLGAGVAAGAGYAFPNTSPTGTAAPVGERWIYATGEVLLAQEDLILRDEMNYLNNDVVVLAERPYVGAVDCFAAAIRVTVEE